MATVPSAFLSKSPKPKRARARVTIFVTRARARLLRCYACSSAVSTAPMSSLKQTERASISRGTNASYLCKKTEPKPRFLVICGV